MGSNDAVGLVRAAEWEGKERFTQNAGGPSSIPIALKAHVKRAIIISKKGNAKLEGDTSESEK